MRIEPSLNPPEDKEAANISERIGDMNLDELAIDIQAQGYDDIVLEKIVDMEFPKEKCSAHQRSFVSELVTSLYSSCGSLGGIAHVMELCVPNTVEKIREDFIDYLIHKEQPEKEYDNADPR